VKVQKVLLQNHAILLFHSLLLLLVRLFLLVHVQIIFLLFLFSVIQPSYVFHIPRSSHFLYLRQAKVPFVSFRLSVTA